MLNSKISSMKCSYTCKLVVLRYQSLAIFKLAPVSAFSLKRASVENYKDINCADCFVKEYC